MASWINSPKEASAGKSSTMAKTKTYKSEAFAAIHETVSGMFNADVIDNQTMLRFDEAC